MDAPPPTHPKHTAAHSRLYASQVRAFIEASEVVDADPDTIEDILDGFDEQVLSVEEDLDVDVQDPDDGRASPVSDQDEQLFALLQEGVCLDASSPRSIPVRATRAHYVRAVGVKGPDKICCTAMLTTVICRPTIAEDAWTKDEVKQLMTYLKENGMRKLASGPMRC